MQIEDVVKMTDLSSSVQRSSRDDLTVKQLTEIGRKLDRRRREDLYRIALALLKQQDYEEKSKHIDDGISNEVSTWE